MMNNKITNYRPNRNSKQCVISTDTFDKNTNEILGFLRPELQIEYLSTGMNGISIDQTWNNTARRFLYTTADVAFFPTNPTYLQAFSLGVKNYVHYGANRWILLTGPLIFPTKDQFNQDVLYYYNGGQWYRQRGYAPGFILSDWQFNGLFYTTLPNQSVNLSYYLQAERRLDPRKDAVGNQYWTDPIIIPIQEYNNARLLGTVTSNDLGQNGITFSNEIAAKLKPLENLMLIPITKTPVNTLGLPVTISPKTSYQKFEPIAANNWSTAASVFGVSETVTGEIFDGKMTAITDRLFSYGDTWPAGQQKYANDINNAGTFFGGMARVGNSNVWNYEKFTPKQVFGDEGRPRRYPEVYQQYYSYSSFLHLYFGNYYDNPTAKDSFKVISPGSNMVFNVYRTDPYKLDPDGTEVILAPSASKFQAIKIRNSTSSNQYPEYPPQDVQNDKFGGTMDYFNMVYLNETNCNLNNNSVEGQTLEYGYLPTGTEIQVHPANIKPLSRLKVVAAIFLTNLTSNQRYGAKNSLALVGRKLQIGTEVFLLGQTTATENGLYQVNEKTWTKNAYIFGDVADSYNNTGNNQGLLPDQYQSYYYHSSLGEGREYYDSSLYVGGPTNNNDLKLFKLSPPWSQQSPSSFPNIQEIIPNEDQIKVIKNSKNIFYSGNKKSMPLFSFLPKGLETGRNYYLIKNGTTIKFASTYQNALDGIAVPLETIGAGAMTIYTSPANENKPLFRLDDNKQTILDPHKIYYLINSYKGIQIADSKEKAIAKEAINLVVPPNTYVRLIANKDDPISMANVWDPLNTTEIEPFNITTPPMYHGNTGTIDNTKLVYGFKNVSEYYTGISYRVRPTEKTIRKRLVIKAGTLTGLVKARNYSYYPWNVGITPIGDNVYFPASPYNYVARYIQGSSYNTYYSPYSTFLYADPRPAEFSVGGVTLKQKQYRNAYRNSDGYVISTVFYPRWENDNAFCQMLATKINAMLSSQDIILEPQGASQTNGFYVSYYQSINVRLTLPVTGFYESVFSYNQFYVGPAKTIIDYATTVPPTTFDIFATVGFTFIDGVLEIKIADTAINVGTVIASHNLNPVSPYLETSHSLEYKEVVIGDNTFLLQQPNDSPNATKSLQFQEGTPVIPIDKKIKLTFDQVVKSIWRRISLSTERQLTLTEYSKGGSSYVPNQNKVTGSNKLFATEAIIGEDIIEEETSVPNVILLSYVDEKNCWVSDPLNANGIKFKIEAAFIDNQPYNNSTSLTLRLRCSPNTYLDFIVNNNSSQITINSNYDGGKLVRKIFENVFRLTDKESLGLHNGYQLSILDPLYRYPKPHSSTDYLGTYWPVGYLFFLYDAASYVIKLLSFLPQNSWGVIQSCSGYGSIISYSIPTAYIVVNATVSNGNGAIFKVITGNTVDPNNNNAPCYYIKAIKVIQGGSKYQPYYDRGTISYTTKTGATVLWGFSIQVNTLPNGTMYDRLINPTDAYIKDLFGKAAPNIYGAPTLGINGTNYIENDAQGPVTIKSLEKIELIDP